MTDHFLKSLEALDEVSDAREALRRVYADGGRRELVAELHQTINVNLKLASVHAALADVQVTRDELMSR